MSPRPDQKYVCAYIDGNLADTLHAMAVAHDRSTAAEIRRALRGWVLLNNETAPAEAVSSKIGRQADVAKA